MHTTIAKRDILVNEELRNVPFVSDEYFGLQWHTGHIVTYMRAHTENAREEKREKGERKKREKRNIYNIYKKNIYIYTYIYE